MNYDLEPETNIQNYQMATQGADNVVTELNNKINSLSSDSTIIFECYPGVDYDELCHEILDKLDVTNIIFADDFAMKPKQVNEIIHRQMTDDRVFGIMTHYTVKDFYPNINLVKNKIPELSN